MKILVINSGSSSIKFQLFDMEKERVLATGLAEKIGEAKSRLSYRRMAPPTEKVVREADIPDHRAGLTLIIDLLSDPECGVISGRGQIAAVGHRVVHGGETFTDSVAIDDDVIAAIAENIPLAPLHNPANLTGIEVARQHLPQAAQVAVFDTAFHATLPPEAFMYALPYRLYEKDRVRRYGFHGTSHAYVTETAAAHLGIPLAKINLITIHLGNGASMAAIENGCSVDTSMGMTPLEGLVMGTRTGDVDPALPFFLTRHLKMTLDEIDHLFNHESGLKGLCGTNDMRELLGLTASGDARAQLALDIYCRRIRKYIGAYVALLGRVDAVIFTAGVGENAAQIRERCCQGLEIFGLAIDKESNAARAEGIRDISAPAGTVKVLVIPTNEELKIARQTRMVIENRQS